MINVGIVGYGKIGEKHHGVLNELEANVVATCNRSEVNRNKALEKGISRVYDNPHDMVQNESLDALVISTALLHNYKVACELIPYQLPILLEKPPGNTIEEIDKLIQLKSKHNTPVMVATNRVWYSVLRKAIDHIGGLDKIEGVNVLWSENPNRLLNDRGFSRSMVHNRNFSNSIHGLSILEYLSGTLLNPSVNGHSAPTGFNRNMILSGVSDRGVTSSFTSSWSTMLPWRLSFYGAGKLYDFSPLETCISTDLTTREKVAIEPEQFDTRFKPGFYLQAKHFLEVVKSPSVLEDCVSLEKVKQLFLYAQSLTGLFKMNDGK